MYPLEVEVPPKWQGWPFRGEGGTLKAMDPLEVAMDHPKGNAPLEGGSAPLVMGVDLLEAKVEPLKVMNPLEMVVNPLE